MVRNKALSTLIVAAIVLSIISIFFVSIISTAVTAYPNIRPGVQKSVEDRLKTSNAVDVIILIDEPAVNEMVDTDAVDTPLKAIQSQSVVQSTKSRSSLLKLDTETLLDSTAGFTKKKSLTIINGYSGTLTRQGLEELRTSNASIRIYEDIRLSVNDGITDGTNLSSQNETLTVMNDPTLGNCTATINADYSWNVLNITGDNVTVVVIDTGVNYNNPGIAREDQRCFGYGTNYSCKVFGGYDFFNGDDDPMDDNLQGSSQGHGTDVASIISASGDYTGVAPNVRLYALKVCDSSGQNCPLSNVLAALNWTKNNFEHIDITSMSMGAFANAYMDTNDIGNTGKDPLSTAVDNLVSNGTTVVVSAGNGGPGVSTITIPAAAEHVISVGAVSDNGTADPFDDTVWSQGGRGPGAFGRLDPDIMGPCAVIQSIAGLISFQAGTSMSAPFVSGSAALLLQKHHDYSPEQVRAILLQSSRNISGKVFEKGAGVVDLMNALDGEVYALVYNTNTLGVNATSDRWEFIVTPYTASFANLTIINNNDFDITLHPSFSTIANMENDLTLDPSQVHIPNDILVSANSNITFQINFSLDDFSAEFPATYGGMMILNGSGNNGTADVIKTIGIPIVVTVPIMNNGYLDATFINIGSPEYSYLNYDIYNYCYYNPKTKNVLLSINWSGTSSDFDMYIYGASQDFISRAATDNVYNATSNESISITEGDVFKWIRIDSYLFDSPKTITLNITETGNHPPNITTVEAIGGTINATDSLIFYRPHNITINVSYADIDNDSVIVSINDSDYISVNNYSSIDGTSGYAIYVRAYNDSSENNSAILVTASDSYGASGSKNINIFLHDSMIVNNYSPAPSSSTIYARKNTTVQFTTDISDVTNKSIYYYWYVNGTLNATGNETYENYTFDTTNYDGILYSLILVAYNNATSNDTNESIAWSVYIDGMAPNISIQNPGAMTLNQTLNQSRVDINYSVHDASDTDGSGTGSGISACWYHINGTSVIDSINNITENYTTDNISLPIISSACSNISIYMTSGIYDLTIYANDSVGNMAYSSVTFDVNDTIPPIISAVSPLGAQAFTESVNLSVITDENASCRFRVKNPIDDDSINYDNMTGNFSDNITSHTLMDYPVSEGEHTLYVRCRDMSSNINNASTLIVFVINSVPSPPSDTGGSGGSGGSSGGGGGSGGSGGGGISGGGGMSVGTGNSSGNNLSTSENFDTLTQGQNNMSITNANIPVSKISLNTNVSLLNVTITLNKTITPGVNYTGGLVYAYLYLDQMNLPPEALLSTKIYFNVDYRWLKENNISKDDITLLQFDNVKNSWDPLATVFLEEDETRVYYATESNGLGLYVISNNRSMMQEGNPRKAEPETNKTLPKNVTLSVNSKTGTSGIGSLFAGAKDFIDNLKKSDDMSRIIFVLVCTFLFVIAIMVAIRKVAGKHYKNELILATDNKLSNVSDELEKKVPNIPKDLERIRLDVARKFSESLSKSSKPMDTDNNPFMNKIFFKSGQKNVSDGDVKKQNDVEALRKEVQKAELTKEEKREESRKLALKEALNRTIKTNESKKTVSNDSRKTEESKKNNKN